MNFAMILKNLGILLIVEAACMLPSLLVAIIYKQSDIMAFIITMMILIIVGFLMYCIPARNKNFYTRDGFAIVSLGWILVSLFGALPFCLSGAIPSFVDALFETLRLLSEMTMPIICIAIGYELKINIKEIGGPLLAIVLRMVLHLGMAYAINEIVIDRLLNLDNTFKIALYTMFLLPPPFVIPVYMDEKEEKNKQFILNTISISIILSLLAFMTLIIIV